MLDFWYQVPGIFVEGGLRRLYTDADFMELMACTKGHKRQFCMWFMGWVSL